MEWTSPDGKIKKLIIQQASTVAKPTENARCDINVINSNNSFNSTSITIGDNDGGEVDRALDMVLQTMSAGEVARILFGVIEIELELVRFTTPDLIYEWKADFKHTLALEYKTKGTERFRNGDIKHASHRYSKGLKILASIPIAVENPPECIDGVAISDINALKVVLYSNLASCYLKAKNFIYTKELCERALKLKPDEIKAMYKLGVAYAGLKEYEKAKDCLNKVIAVQPDNKSARSQLSRVQVKLNEQDAVYKSVVRKMFS